MNDLISLFWPVRANEIFSLTLIMDERPAKKENRAARESPFLQIQFFNCWYLEVNRPRAISKPENSLEDGVHKFKIGCFVRGTNSKEIYFWARNRHHLECKQRIFNGPSEPLFVYFRSFQTNKQTIQFLPQINVKMYNRWWDLKPRTWVFVHNHKLDR